MNTIPTLQNGKQQLRLLRARSQTYRHATALFVVQLVLILLVPLVGAVWGLFVPEAKPFFAFIALTMALMDVVWLDRAQRELIKLAAKIGEQFDCVTLELPWNAFVVGRPADPEIVHGAAIEYTKRRKVSRLRNWYPKIVSQVPIHQARIICQRTNLWYDSRLRRFYGSAIIWTSVILVSLLLFGVLIADLSMSSFVMSVMAPAAPVLIWSVRECHRHRDAANFLDNIRAQSEMLWERAKNGECDPEECKVEARKFQDAIYTHRATNPLIFPGVYTLLRPMMEKQMQEGAAHWVREAGYDA